MRYSLYEMVLVPLLTLVTVIGSMWLVSCTPQLGEYVPRHRDYKTKVEFAETSERPAPGALLDPESGG